MASTIKSNLMKALFKERIPIKRLAPPIIKAANHPALICPLISSKVGLWMRLYSHLCDYDN